MNISKKEISPTSGRSQRDLLQTYQLGITRQKDEGAGYTVATVALKTRAVKRFFEYLEASNHILINPAEYLKEPKKESRLPRAVLSEEEARRVLDQPNLSSMTGIRDRTVLEVFYSTGIRLQEMVNLTIFDCDLQGGLLRVNKGKFAKDRAIPLGKHAVRFLKKYIARVRPLHTQNNRTIRNLFVNHLGNPLSRAIIEIMVRKYAKAAGIQKKVTPHVFRHTFATHLVKNGADITAVQKMLGHSHLRVTQIYTRVAGIEVKRTHQTSHPREKDQEPTGKRPPGSGWSRGITGMIDLLGEYQKHLTVLNYAPGTIKGHLFYLNRFLGFLKEREIQEVSGVTKDVIQAYQADLYEQINRRGEPNSVASQNNGLKAVKSFFRFLAKQGYLIGDPARDISYARAPKRLPRSILTQAETKKVLHAPDTKTILGYRDRTFLRSYIPRAFAKKKPSTFRCRMWTARKASSG